MERKEAITEEGISRRALVGSAALGALGLFGASMVACSPNRSDGDADTHSVGGANTADITWNEEADLVVVGSGGGLAGAVTAAEAGLSVIVLEKEIAAGGSTALHSGVMACGGGTSLQKEAGITDSPEEYKKYLMACAKGQAYEPLVTALATEFRDSFEWLVELGVPFTTDMMYYTGPEEEPYCVAATPPVMHAVLLTPDEEHALTGTVIHSYVQAKAEELGVRVLMEVAASDLITDAEGAVIGVVAQDGSESINIKAKKGVILAGGGMCNNPDMLKQYMRFGEYRTGGGGKGSTGDTIKMAQAVGADLVNMHEALSSPALAVTLGTTTRGKERASFPSFIVNKDGKRYVNEDYHSDTVGKLFLGQEDGLSWQIFDEQSISAVREAFKSSLITASTVEELAQNAGIHEMGLVDTMNRWNEFAANGNDPDFNKKGGTVKPLSAPFYAFPLPLSISLVVQYGGIKVDEKCQAINVWGEPIPRLFSAGIDAGGWLGRNYPGSGHGAGGAYAMARIAAREIAATESWDA